MNKRRNVRVVFWWVILAICVWHSLAQCQPSKPGQKSTLVGRDDPFAKISRPKEPIQSQFLQPAALDEPVAELFLETVTLKFLDAVTLEKAMKNMSSQYGSLKANPKNNSLIVCDTKENLTRILDEIRKVDRTPQQILIEAVIVDVQLTDDSEIGVNWDILSSKNYDISYRQNLTSRLGSTVQNAATIGNASAFVTAGTGGDFAIISGTIRNVIHMLQQKKNVEILASPRVMVLSGYTASIQAIEEIPYRVLTETSMGGELATVEFKKVGIKLDVTATVTDGNDILINVVPEQNINTSVFGIENIPIIDTRVAHTTLLLKDGQVVVIAGLRRKEKTKSRDQIPFLGDLPVVGFIFGRDKIVTKNSELILFLSPHIYKGEAIPEDQMNKYKEITNRPMLSIPDEDGKSKVDEVVDTLSEIPKLLGGSK